MNKTYLFVLKPEVNPIRSADNEKMCWNGYRSNNEPMATRYTLNRNFIAIKCHVSFKRKTPRGALTGINDSPESKP